MKYEFILWFNHFLKLIPGKIGCAVRNLCMPYLHGKNVFIWDNIQIDKPSKLVMKDNISINRGCIINAGGGIFIDSDVLIGPNVVIYSQNHQYKDLRVAKRLQGYNYKSVTIERNVWIAANCIILPGVKIGSNSVVAAGSVVSKDIPTNSLYIQGEIRPLN